jgi:hypothetical protein
MSRPKRGCRGVDMTGIAPHCEQIVVYRTTKSEMVEWTSTFCVSLPRMSADTPRRP